MGIGLACRAVARGNRPALARPYAVAMDGSLKQEAPEAVNAVLLEFLGGVSRKGSGHGHSLYFE
jgi:hypothetical protein